MKNLLLIGMASLIVLSSCKNKNENEKAEDSAAESQVTKNQSTNEEAVKFPVYNFESFEPLLYHEDDKTYVINFWATWCKPCIAELPYFEKVNAEMEGKVEVILVSLDMPSMWKSRLEPFVENKKLQSEVVILDDPKQNDWIPKISEEWGGGIPATLIYNRDKRSFYERGFTYEELNTELNKFIN